MLTLTPPPAIYTHSLHDALPIFEHLGVRELCEGRHRCTRATGANCDDELFVCLSDPPGTGRQVRGLGLERDGGGPLRSEEHTSELQSQSNLVCRLLLEK